jgi:hypothetical protein
VIDRVTAAVAVAELAVEDLPAGLEVVDPLARRHLSLREE